MSPPRPEKLRKFTENLGRGPLYISVLVLLGALAIPVVWMNRRIGRGEKLFLCIMGLLQTVAVVGLLIVFFIWAYRMMSGATSTGGPQNPFGL